MLKKLSDKIFVFTDLHFGIHSNSQSYIDICSNTLKWISKYCAEHAIKDVLFMGDFFDSRASVDVKTLNFATQSLYDLADSGVNVTLILGNHDIYLRDSTSIHSLLAFGGHKGINIVDKDVAVDIDNCEHCALLLPWMHGIPSKKVEVPRRAKYVFSHHNFPSNFFMGGGFQKKKNRSDTFISKTPYEDEFGIQQEILDTVVENCGVFFSGHIHQHKTIPLKNGSSIIIEGSPYETSWGFNNVECGAYVVDFKNGIFEFVPNPHNKKHVEIRTSSSERDMENVDFKNSIVRLNVDTQESFDTISKLQSKINSMNPFSVENTKYEFTVAEFVGNRDEMENPLDSINSKVSSKLDYIINAIDKGDFSSFAFLDSDGNTSAIDKERLKEIATEIFDKSAKRG